METIIIISIISLIAIVFVLIYFLLKLKKKEIYEKHRANINEILAKENKIEAEKYRNQTLYFYDKCKEKDSIINKLNKNK